MSDQQTGGCVRLPDDLEMTPAMEKYLPRSIEVTHEMREHAKRLAEQLGRGGVDG